MLKSLPGLERERPSRPNDTIRPRSSLATLETAITRKRNAAIPGNRQNPRKTIIRTRQSPVSVVWGPGIRNRGRWGRLGKIATRWGRACSLAEPHESPAHYASVRCAAFCAMGSGK